MSQFICAVHRHALLRLWIPCLTSHGCLRNERLIRILRRKRHGFRKPIELQACDAVHIDIPKSGGLLESKRISDMADLYYIWTAAHNPASPLGTIASAHAASSMRSFRIHELAKYIDWWQDLVIHDGPIFDGGYLTIQDKPGYGVEINPDVAKAHLAPGETWWG